MVETYKCPGCGASLVYEEGSEALICPYCETKVAVSELKKQKKANQSKEDDRKKQKQQDFEKAEGSKKEDVDGTAHFHCSSCGGELLTDAYTAATVCPFCGSPAILKERLEGKVKPDTVIPFAIGKEQAREIFRKWTKSGLFTPKGFHSQNTLDSIKGIYVPYWLYDYDVNVHMTASATRVRTSRKGDTEYTYTDHFLIERDTEGSFIRIPADASKEMPDDTMERLEPFDYKELKPFELPYLSGYFAECTNFPSEALQPRTEERAREYAERTTRDTIEGYSSVMVTGSNVRAQLRHQEYAMLPVWVLDYNCKGKNWKIYLNGQTGRKIGSLPISKGRVAVCYGITSIICTLIAALVWGLLL